MPSPLQVEKSKVDRRSIDSLAVLGKYLACQCITNMCSNSNPPTLFFCSSRRKCTIIGMIIHDPIGCCLDSIIAILSKVLIFMVRFTIPRANEKCAEDLLGAFTCFCLGTITNAFFHGSPFGCYPITC
jgi:hypothetical protein